MEPQQARLTFVAFLALSLVIIVNAVFMQADAGFAVRSAYQQVQSTPISTAPSAHELGGAQTQGQSLVRAIRRELSQRNYFPGNATSRLDQRLDAMTMGAIMAYQYDNGLLVTGIASDALLKSFLFGVDEVQKKSGKAPRMSRDTRQLVAEVQGVLSAKGYYGGKIDGVFKGKTQAAIKRFESEKGLPVAGRISGLLVQELARATGVAFTASQK